MFVASLCKERSALIGFYENIVVLEENICFFKSWLPIRVLHECIRLAALSEDQHDGDHSSTSKTDLILAGLDAFVVTALTVLQEDGKGSVKDHRKEVYRDAF